MKHIFDQQCVICHAGVIGGSWPLTDYDHVYQWKDDIRGAMVQCSMPPPDGGVPMPIEQRNMLLRWIRCDMPR